MATEQFNLHYDVLPDALMLVSGIGDVLAVSQGVARRFGLPAPTLVGRRLDELVAEPPDRVTDYLRLCSRGRDMLPGSLTLRRGCESVPCRAEGAVFRPRCGDEPAQILLRLRPRTTTHERFMALSRRFSEQSRELVRHGRREAEARHRAEALAADVRRNDEHLSVLAHEIRNPLAPINNGLQVLEQAGLPEAIAGQCRRILRRQVRQLARLADDLLDLAWLRHGRLQVRREPLDLSALVADILEACRPLLEERRHALRYSPKPGVVVSADPVRLEQILVNLISNAARFTEPGGEIRVRVATDGNDALLTVRDTGAGIPAELLEEIFTPFGPPSRKPLGSAPAGLGIGLSIARHLVALHGGTLTASSPGRGLGSEFTMRVPRLTGPTAQAPGEESAPAVAVRPLRVLVVDDSRDAADSFAIMLTLQGHRARVAYDGPTGLELARLLRPEVALINLAMPEMDGFQLAQELRRQTIERPPVLVALTGFGLEDVQRSRDAGFSHHLVKPVSPNLLHQLLNELARRPAS
jgi:signal transduction histidine kinase/CheY-like chemotaxis protein